MHYAIIAAGEGSRLHQEGVQAPKPLIGLCGLPLVDRLLGILMRHDAESVSIICRSGMTDVVGHLHQFQKSHPYLDLRLIDATTPSSMHSLALLSEQIPEGKVCVMTVDTVFREAEFADYVKAFESSASGLFAVTSYVDDEKPLWVETSGDGSITAFCDREDEMRSDAPRWVSGGIYGLDTRWAWPVLRQCIAEGQSRMRNYQRALVLAGVQLRAYRFGNIMDIDHADDITKAESWLREVARQEGKRLLAVSRIPSHSPNHVDNDARILSAVTSRLEAQGYVVQSIREDRLRDEGCNELRHCQFILSMARLMPSLTKLAQVDALTSIINAPLSVLHVSKSREMVMTLLQQAGVSVPAWWAYDPESDEMFQCEPELQQLLPGWIKAMREVGAQPDDVSWVETPLQADARVIELVSQGVPDIVVTKHVEGDLMKVYAVVDLSDKRRLWMHGFYPQESHYSKFGVAEQHNTQLQHIAYEPEALHRLVWQVAGIFRLQVFGIDLIVQPDGTLTVIDVNDWPSFSPCWEEASCAIANQCIVS